ncbi:MAG: IPT/TIG domain-containing protein [Candidatus Promineifilaceae bacterium]
MLFILVWLVYSAEATPLNTSPPTIEIANISGIEGQTISIFGDGFGNTQGNGSVTILGSVATVGSWSNSFISVTVPTVANGTGHLQLTTNDGSSTTSPFTVYTVNGNFLIPVDPTLNNIMQGKTALTQNVENTFCFKQPNNANTPPSEFLTDYQCGYAGFTNSGSVEFTADSSLAQTAIIAVDLEQTLSGSFYFQFFSDNNWYPRLDEASYRPSFPRDYTIELSADSTTGFDGTWTPFVTVTNNSRDSRSHYFTVPNGSHQWLRMRVTDGINDRTTAAGRDFSLREIRLYQTASTSGLRPDSVAHYGDSLSADAFQLLGPQGFAQLVRSGTRSSTDLMFTSFGLSGQNSSGFVDQPSVDHDIHDALALDNLDTHALYWGISIGINDAFDGESRLTDPNSNIYHYPARLDAIVQALIAQGRVPIVARIADTDESQGGFGDFASKKYVLEAIDTVAATYGLIPGPDLYVTFRRNIETDGASYFKGDGTHHVTAGQARMVELWANAFATGTSGALAPTSTQLQAAKAHQTPHLTALIFMLSALFALTLFVIRQRIVTSHTS